MQTDLLHSETLLAGASCVPERKAATAVEQCPFALGAISSWGFFFPLSLSVRSCVHVFCLLVRITGGLAPLAALFNLLLSVRKKGSVQPRSLAVH